MREDFQEQLDKIFPRGYVIVYTFTTSEAVRCAHYNPYGYAEIEQYRNLIVESD